MSVSYKPVGEMTTEELEREHTAMLDYITAIRMEPARFIGDAAEIARLRARRVELSDEIARRHR